MPSLKIRRALLTVSDKTGVVELGRALSAAGAELVATGSPGATLAAHYVRHMTPRLDLGIYSEGTFEVVSKLKVVGNLTGKMRGLSGSLAMFLRYAMSDNWYCELGAFGVREKVSIQAPCPETAIRCSETSVIGTSKMQGRLGFARRIE